ncbi:MAG: hypothetical protein FJ109_16145 [Deltaproteobacteria bacterium]|nr:hypothetical protein [Deltaproteobacteria bacterium]
MRLLLATLVTLLLAAGCGSGESEPVEEEPGITFPHTVTLGPELALVAPTGEILDHADFLDGDLVTYKNQTIKLQSGCEVSQAHCRPLHICRPTPSSTPDTFTTVKEVCMVEPAEDEPSIIANAETGMGFTVRLNTANGFGRFWVKEVTGLGDSAKVTLVYELFHMEEEL